ncbi:Protein tyrosine phosphatase domain-containing protein 1 [Entophlyctis sp. JEL0112]|nr:Protein tyrosine phosphatase domain-containing protein 1 [Entophlyctis sp. JEL0112]
MRSGSEEEGGWRAHSSLKAVVVCAPPAAVRGPKGALDVEDSSRRSEAHDAREALTKAVIRFEICQDFNMTSLHCFFCGGHSCKYEDYTQWAGDPAHPNAFDGLYSNWITPEILATQRLSTRLIQKFNLISVFLSHNIRAVFNLQLPGEHATCGDGLDPRNSLWAYEPEDLMNEGISHYPFGWPDLDVPTNSHMLKIVQVLSHELNTLKYRVAVHCHAGLGRTGLTIACYLVYQHNLDPSDAVALVRTNRPGSIQNTKQQGFVHSFQEYIKNLKCVFPLPNASDKMNDCVDEDERVNDIKIYLPRLLTKSGLKETKSVTLTEIIENQRSFLHGEDLRQLWNVPKIIVLLSQGICRISKSNNNYNIELCGQICSFDTSKKPEDELREIMTEFNDGNWNLIGFFDRFPLEKSQKLLVELLLFWILMLKEPLVPDSFVCAVEKLLSNDVLKPKDILLNIQLAEKTVFCTLNHILNIFRHGEYGDHVDAALIRLAILLTSFRFESAQAGSAVASAGNKSAVGESSQHLRSFTDTDNIAKFSGEVKEDLTVLPPLPGNNLGLVLNERKRLSSAPPGSVGLGVCDERKLKKTDLNSFSRVLKVFL